MNDMKIAVIGSGLMGGGIAQLCAQSGYKVYNIDSSEQSLMKAQKTIESLFDKKIAKQKMSVEDKREIINRITYTTDFMWIKETDLIIEAVPEKIEIKTEIFKKIDSMANDNAVMVSNTSGLSISQIASVTTRPDKVMGAHFFYPAPVMKLLELVRGLATSDETYNTVKEFALSINKTVVDAPEYPGFIVNRVLVPMQNEAAYLVMEGCKPEDVDEAMKLGANFPMGPLELTDFVGVDIMLATMTGLYNGFKDSKYRPCPLLEIMVKAGHLGRKTGQGFYNYK